MTDHRFDADPVAPLCAQCDEPEVRHISIDDIAVAPPDHTCTQHPDITHARWLECQLEARQMIDDVMNGVEDPEMAAILREHDERVQRELKRYRS